MQRLTKNWYPMSRQKVFFLSSPFLNPVPSGRFAIRIAIWMHGGAKHILLSQELLHRISTGSSCSWDSLLCLFIPFFLCYFSYCIICEIVWQCLCQDRQETKTKEGKKVADSDVNLHCSDIEPPSTIYFLSCSSGGGAGHLLIGRFVVWSWLLQSACQVPLGMVLTLSCFLMHPSVYEC